MKRAGTFLLLLGICLQAATIWAAPPWRILAQKITYFDNNRIIVAEGEVEVYHQDLAIYADRLRYDLLTENIYAYGHLRVRSGEDWIQGQEGIFNVRTATGTIQEAHLFIKKENFHVLARQIRKTGPETYEADQAVITTCDTCRSCPQRPAWSFFARRAKLTAEGYAKGYSVTFRVKDRGFLYSPYVSVATRAHRKTGLLLPRLTGGNRHGFGLEIPFFWAINDSLDLTFFPNYMAKRGLMTGVEFRYAWAKGSKGVFQLAYLNDKLKDDDYNDDGILRENKHRWWLKGKADHRLPRGFMAKLDLDLVSDKDFPLEFRSDPLGYDKAQRMFMEEFGRGIQVDTATIRTSTAQVSGTLGHNFLLGQLTWHDNQNPGGQKTTLQELPLLEWRNLKHPFWGPFYFEARNRYQYFWREEGTKGHRLDLHSKISLPLPTQPYLDVTLAYGLRETLYKVDWDSLENRKSYLDRTLYDLTADISTTILRVFYLQWRGIEKVRHSLRPRLLYTYIPPKDQKDLPYFDGGDRVATTNKITYSLTNFLTIKRETAPRRYAYRDVLRFKVQQSYSFREANRELTSPKDRRRPYSDIYVELEFTPHPKTYFRYDANFSVYGQGTTSANIILRLQDSRGSSLRVDWRRQKSLEVEELNSYLIYSLTPRLSLIFGYKKNLASDERVDTRYGLRYRSQCWQGEVTVLSTPYETRFTFLINLLGIGRFGL
ncbi:LPS-assembly protein LptD [Thermosulfuriphilus ammonigenes]|uniref:LPS-assembly protein LptD n=1 Tax=Thermosulfuriphilus ammonigenes TaxID=1936021 RepID=A0A6G7PX90_9BACT|nr:LPS assembly protein LptD [Thermosulfuriphilus ammonigenes]MBA2849591.1 LPS-assembly protein [Thermosulfuriphilus ammonigenes]QIJ72304.1 LPS-assembly protein LptD [Thermosulfuriphilus ammonigenes]